MLRALLGRFVPYAAALFVTLGCGAEGGDQEGTSPPEKVGTVAQAAIGDACTNDGDCGECEECTGPGGAKTCTAKLAGVACGDNADTPCSNPDTCDGAGACQTNDEAPGFACGDPTDDACTNPDTCDGSGVCEVNDEPAGTTCGDPTDDACTNPDTCDGSGVCELNDEPAGTTCGDPTDDACTNPDTCDGSGFCEVNDEPAGTTCGDPTDNACTNPDTCDGSGACQANNATPGTSCGDSTNDACTSPDSCDANGVCQPNHAIAGTTCGDATDDACKNPDTCNGSGVCQSNDESAGTACGDPTDDACKNPDTCNAAGACVSNDAPPGTACGDPTNDACKNPDTCNAAGACVSNDEAPGTACGSPTNTACNKPDTCDAAGVCQQNFEPTTTACGSPTDNACTNPDTCDGAGSCDPHNEVAGTSCTSGTDDPSNLCDARDTCDGSGVCVDRFITDTSTICKVAGIDATCDPADTCSGVDKTCPTRFASAVTACVSGTQQPGNPCDAPDRCNGSGSCVDLINTSTATTCLAGTGVCDPDDKCTGVNKSCPAIFANTNTNCTSATNTNGVCDAPDKCNGAGACSDLVAASGTVCAAANGTCNPADTCTGTDKTCTVNLAAAGTSCTSATNTSGACDAPDTCDANGTCVDNIVTDTNTVCKPAAAGANAVCDPADHCTGTDKTCPTTLAPDGTACDSGTNNNALGCEAPDTCNALGVCVDRVLPLGEICQVDLNPAGPAGDCDVDDRCNGTVKSCPELYADAGTLCDDGIDCTPAGSSKCLVNGTCATGTLTDSLCPQPGDPLAACASWTCDPTKAPVAGAPIGCQVNNTPFGTSVPCRVAAPGDTCDISETCNGTDVTCPADAVKPSTEECRPASCSNATGQAVEAASCPGPGGKQCPAMVTVQCGNYLCTDDLKACRTDCTSSAHCIASHYCNNGTCEPRVGAGNPCENDSQCSTSNPHCVDGVCCNDECEGQCQSCNQDGLEGTCSVMPTGSQPEGERPACDGDGSACDGFCNGTDTDACEYPGTDTQCSDDACDPATNVATVGAFCDGAGACPASEDVDCAPYACGETQCNGDCQADSECADGSICRAGMCVPKIPDGDACTRASECESGFCVDGVCCNSRCDGQCEACSLAGQEGSCSAVTGAPVGSRPDCAGTGDCAGTCDGSVRTACTYPGRETECQAAGCVNGTATVVAVCNGKGVCPAGAPIECPTGACEGDVCAGDECVVDADCPSGEYCVAATCQPKLPPGGQCADDGDCESGFCTDGVCCDSACLGQCEACDVAGSEGTCSPVPAGEAPHGARTACTSDGSACGGTCDGTNTAGCNYPVGDVCRPGSCDDGSTGAVAVVEATCQGSGRCPGAAEQACGQYACTGPDGQCDGPCANDPDACADGEYCSAGVCVEQRPPGEACGSADECDSGYCVDGVCCSTQCGGQCEACDVAGSVGECTPVSGATHGGRPACEGTGPCGGLCDGSSRDSCGFAESGASCGGAFCSSGVASEGQICDGAGRCTEGETERCLSYGCDGAVCGTECASDADCTGENLCVDGACILNTLIDARDEGTCGCRVPGGTGPNRGALAALAVAALGALYRRRRRAAGSAWLQ